jgi:2-polyprenyl-3-methyl-5-hydroxy-6-metoxy-1,4-benzoquinol methylase
MQQHQQRDNEAYWVDRHEKLQGSLASVGKIGTPEAENRQRYARKKRRVVDLLRVLGPLDLTGRTALDVGCGVGMISEMLFALGARVYGIDASPIAIDEARDRAAPRHMETGEFKVGSVIDFRFDRFFDLTLCLDVLYHVVDDDNWEMAVRNLARHTQRGGFLILLDQLRDQPERPAPHVRFRTRQMYDTVLTSVGGAYCTPTNHAGFSVYIIE